MRIRIALGLALLALSAGAQPSIPSLADLCAGQVPDEFDAALHADDFCALLAHKPAAARQHLSTAIQRNRAANNPNRLYFDARRGSEPGLYVQLLRPWMAAENAAGIADWMVSQHRGKSRMSRSLAVVGGPYERPCGGRTGCGDGPVPPVNVALELPNWNTVVVRITDMSGDPDRNGDGLQDRDSDMRVIGFDLEPEGGSHYLVGPILGRRIWPRGALWSHGGGPLAAQGLKWMWAKYDHNVQVPFGEIREVRYPNAPAVYAGTFTTGTGSGQWRPFAGTLIRYSQQFGLEAFLSSVAVFATLPPAS